MDIAVLHNHRSGRGAGADAARSLENALRGAGHGVRTLEAEREMNGRLTEQLRSADLLVVAGGDGTVHYAADAAIAAGVPVYHYPMGTENLFAREFGMSPNPRALLRAVGAWNVRNVDVGRANGRPFLIMLSIGPDAGVIARLAKDRRGPISHWSYLRPILAEIRSPSLTPLTVEVDGQEVVSGRTGLLVVGNSRQYALRVDPAARADVDDGLLDVVFLPASTALGVLWWVIKSRLRLHLRDPRAVYRRGREVRIGPGGALPAVQADGELWEAKPLPPHSGGGLSISVESDRLKVLSGV